MIDLQSRLENGGSVWRKNKWKPWFHLHLGAGAYFADDPRKSHGYAEPDGTNQSRVMFYSKVTLGKESVKAAADNTLVAAPVDFQPVKETAFQYPE